MIDSNVFFFPFSLPDGRIGAGTLLLLFFVHRLPLLHYEYSSGRILSGGGGIGQFGRGAALITYCGRKSERTDPPHEPTQWQAKKGRDNLGGSQKKYEYLTHDTGSSLCARG